MRAVIDSNAKGTMTKKATKPASKASFVRTLPVTTPIADVIAAGKKAGLAIPYNTVWSEQKAMREREGTTTALVAQADRLDKELENMLDHGTANKLAGLSRDMDKLNESIARGDYDGMGPRRDTKRDSRSFEAIGSVCEALAPLEQADGERVMQAAIIMLGWQR